VERGRLVSLKKQLLARKVAVAGTAEEGIVDMQLSKTGGELEEAERQLRQEKERLTWGCLKSDWKVCEAPVDCNFIASIPALQHLSLAQATSLAAHLSDGKNSTYVLYKKRHAEDPEWQFSKAVNSLLEYILKENEKAISDAAVDLARQRGYVPQVAGYQDIIQLPDDSTEVFSGQQNAPGEIKEANAPPVPANGEIDDSSEIFSGQQNAPGEIEEANAPPVPANGETDDLPAFSGDDLDDPPPSLPDVDSDDLGEVSRGRGDFSVKDHIKGIKKMLPGTIGDELKREKSFLRKLALEFLEKKALAQTRTYAKGEKGKPITAMFHAFMERAFNVKRKRKAMGDLKGVRAGQFSRAIKAITRVDIQAIRSVEGKESIVQIRNLGDVESFGNGEAFRVARRFVVQVKDGKGRRFKDTVIVGPKLK
jgi:hypothetical protein